MNGVGVGFLLSSISTQYLPNFVVSNYSLYRALYWTMKYLQEGDGRYRMYAINYIIDYLCHGRDESLDKVLHVLNELSHGVKVEKILMKLILHGKL